MDVVTLLLLFKEHINNAGTCLLCLKLNENLKNRTSLPSIMMSNVST